MDEGRFLAAYESSGAFLHTDFEIEARSENIPADEALFPGLPEGNLKSFNGQRIFCPDVDVGLSRSDGVGGDAHALDEPVGIPFNDGAVHKCSRIALIGIANQVFFL